MKRILTIILLVLTSATAFAKKEADLIIKSGRIFGVEPEWFVYEAMAIKKGKIIALGTDEEILGAYTAKQVIDAKDKYVYPGFIDAHFHFSGYAYDKYKCDLTNARSYDEMLVMLKTYEKKNKLSWVYGRGWDQNKWQDKEFPNKDALDALFPNKPVILKRVDGHAMLCNQKALDMAHININTEIPGGTIEKKDGKLTGILVDNAMDPVEKIIPRLPKAQVIKYLEETQKECYENGLTGIVEPSVTADRIKMVEELYKQKKLDIGYTIMMADDSVTLSEYAAKGKEHFGQLQINGIKVFADGALGSRGACLLAPYSDDPGNYGHMTTPANYIRKMAGIALKYNLQLCTHAIGDSANRVVLKIYADSLKKKNDKRWRVEHAQVLNGGDIHYFGDYSIVPSVQPTHFPSDMPWCLKRLGKRRMEYAYSYGWLLKQNGWEALGTDFPVEPMNPIATFYTAVYRTDSPQGYGLYERENGLEKMDAIKGITIWAAKSVFLEKTKGSIEVGKDADLVILNNDLTLISQESTMSTQVLYTIVGGKIMYKKKVSSKK